MSKSKVCLVIGAGDATGGAVAKRFAREGYVACVTRRTLEKLNPLLESIQQFGGVAHGFASDARQENEVIELIEHIESNIGPIGVMVFNIGANSPNSILTETARRYTKMWEMACLAGFLNGREVAKRMVARHTIIDGAIDTEFIRTLFPERYALKDQGGVLNPDHIADAYWMLHQQPRDAWTHELDLRPYMEKF